MQPQTNKHYKALEIESVLEYLSKHAITSLAKNKIAALKILDENKIEYELSLVRNAKKIIDDASSNLPLEEIMDTENMFSVFKPIGALEIIELAKNLKLSRICKNFILKSNEQTNLSAIVQNLYIDKAFEDEVFSAFDKELNVVDSASSTLKSLRNSYKDNKENLKQAINSLLQNPSFTDNLQDTVVTTRDNRPVFQVKASNKNKVQGIVHDVSSTNLTYYIEPSSLVPLSNKLKQIEVEIKAEIDRIIFSFKERFKDIKKELESNQKILIKLDIIFAKAKYAIKLHAIEPEIIKEKRIDIQAMKHPLLVEFKDDVVENDFILGKNYKSLLITGSNTGGKTVALKTVGLFVLMTKMGLFLPCLSAKIHPFEKIFCDISSEQSLEQGFSTFSAHIKNISDILDELNDKSLILLDELGSGTDPVEGWALANSILKYIKEKDALSIVTTHLGQLKSLKYEDNYFENATVLFDIKTLKPMYKLIIGISGMSNAIDISSELGLNSTVIQNARNILKNEGNNVNNIFQKIEQTNQNLIKEQQKAKENLEKSKETKDELEQKLNELKSNKKKSLENFKKKFQNQLEGARGEIKEIIEEIRKEKSLKVTLRAYDKINKLENKIRQEFSKSDDELSQKYQKLDIENLKIGQNVLVKKLDQVVILDSLPDKKGFVQIRIGNIKSKINIKDLAHTDKKVAPHLKKVQITFDNTDNLLSRLDLRGMRVIEAIEYLDNNLDKASLRGLNQITVIHGYGTGALKSAVNEYLKTSPYVSKFHYGDETEGRDGVVIVNLR